MNKRILLIGPQGSGKSTQAKLLAKYLKIPVISTGDIFREMAPLHEWIRKILEEGKLVDDKSTSKVVEKRLREKDCRDGFILDGYPRNLEQIRLFDPKFDLAVYLSLPEKQVIQRLMKRGRADDSRESIERRLDLYFRQTTALLDYYRNLGILHEIDAQNSIEEIQNEIQKYL